MAVTKWGQFVRVYWPTGILIITPIIFLPLILLNNWSPAYNCLYVLIVMSVYWTTEAIPLAITSMLPIVLFPLLGILDTFATCRSYMSEATMMFLGGLIIAMALQHSELHTRFALIIISWIGCSPKKITMGLFFCNMFLSMWMSNTAAVTIMIPIIMGVLLEMEKEGLCQIYEPITHENYKGQRKIEVSTDRLTPSKTTLCFFLGSAFASSIGGCGTIIGSGSNLVLKGIYEKRFPTAPNLSFNSWLFFNFPFVVAATVGTWVYLQWMYMGMFRPNSAEAVENNRALEVEHVVREVIRKRLVALGPLNAHQLSVAIIFCFAVVAYLTRDPGFMTGWIALFPNSEIMDTTISLLVVILFFILPRNYDFLKLFTARRRSDLPKKAPQALLTWNHVQDHMEWGLIFLLGGGFALSAGGKVSGLNHVIRNQMESLEFLRKFELIIVVTIIAVLATEICSNLTVANITLPVFAEIALMHNAHPLYFMLPVCLACSFAFLLPVSTPPNAIVAGFMKIPTKEMVKAGLGPSVICLVLLWGFFATWGLIVYPELQSFPAWARESTNIESNGTIMVLPIVNTT